MTWHRTLAGAGGRHSQLVARLSHHSGPAVVWHSDMLHEDNYVPRGDQRPGEAGAVEPGLEGMLNPLLLGQPAGAVALPNPGLGSLQALSILIAGSSGGQLLTMEEAS